MDICKAAEIVCPILSCRDCDVGSVALDPFKNAKAFDDHAYQTLKYLKLQVKKQIS
jgi:pyruvate dehydrogenase E1 component beta subunit/pre-rRNA-processing protein TSR1